jgi:hypothetical protein
MAVDDNRRSFIRTAILNLLFQICGVCHSTVVVEKVERPVTRTVDEIDTVRFQISSTVLKRLDGLTQGLEAP